MPAFTTQDLAIVVPSLDSAGVDLLSVSLHLIYLLKLSPSQGKKMIINFQIF